MITCIICRIIVGTEPSKIIYSDDKTLAFLDKFPVVAGHTLVVLKKHGATLHDYEAQELTDLLTTTQKIAKALEKTYNTKQLTIGINHGELSGLPHLHFHIIPRFADDGGKIIQSLVYNRPKVDLKSVQERIKRNI